MILTPEKLCILPFVEGRPDESDLCIAQIKEIKQSGRGRQKSTKAPGKASSGLRLP
jgi:hypothetical protein